MRSAGLAEDHDLARHGDASLLFPVVIPASF
jgi:hypothetical protein